MSATRDASLLVTNVAELVTCDPTVGDGSPLGVLRDAAFVVEAGRVAWVGEAASAPSADERLDAEGRAVVPGFVDSHTHLVFDGDRAAEFAARMAGERYDGGGIRTTVAATRAASDERLRDLAASRLAEMHASGTTTIEAKSGYGLDVATERRILEVSRDFTPETTFLAAHVVPSEFADDRGAYVDLVCGEMLDACAPYARWIDVFCETGAFDAEESRRVLEAGRERGLGLRVHGNQLGEGLGARLAVELGAASVDHCTYLSDTDIEALAASSTVATLLPGADFSTRSPYPDARRLLDAGATVALATDLNPGTSFVTSMPFVIALAVREMRMTAAEALWAATTGGAIALERDDVGWLGVGAAADFALLEAPSHEHLAYRPGSRLVAQTWRCGARIFGR